MGKGRGQPGAEGRWSQPLGSRGPVCPVAVGSSQPCSLPAPTWWCGLGSRRLADCDGPSPCLIHSNAAILGGVPGAVVTLSPWRGA